MIFAAVRFSVSAPVPPAIAVTLWSSVIVSSPVPASKLSAPAPVKLIVSFPLVAVIVSAFTESLIVKVPLKLFVTALKSTVPEASTTIEPAPLKVIVFPSN